MATAGSSFGGGGGGKGKGKGKGKDEGKGDACRLCCLPCVDEKLSIRLPDGHKYCADCLQELVDQAKPPEQPPCLESLPKVLVQGLLEHLDALSLAEASLSSKMLCQEGKHVAKQVVEHLREQLLFSRFVRFPELGDEPAAATSASSSTTAAVTTAAAGRVSYLEMMWRLTKDEQEVLIMGGCESEILNEVTKMIVKANDTIRFEASTPMLQARYLHDAVYHQGEVLSISSNGGAGHGTMERLDKLTQTRTLLAERSPNYLCNTSAAMFSNKLLVIGGQHQIAGQLVRSDIVYELDEHASQAAQGKWRAHAARLNTARSCAAAIAFEGKVFVCGGDGAFRIVESFDPAIGAWQVEGEQMTKNRSFFSLFEFEDELYAVAGDGYGQNTTIEKRNKATKQWQLVADCGQNRCGCAAVLVGSKVFLFGGEGHSFTFEFFDFESKKWASQDVGGAYFDEDKRQLPRQVYHSKAVLITPAAAEAKEWTDLHLPLLKQA